METAEEQFSSEETEDETKLMSVEGELNSKMALLSKLRETLKERSDKMHQMETERSVLVEQLNKVLEESKIAEEEAGTYKSDAGAM